MATAILHTEFQHKYDLDHAELSFLSVMYYQQRENSYQPVSFTQDHIANLTGLGIYAQRRVRKTLSNRGLMTESRSMRLVEDEGYRTSIVYDIRCRMLDALLAEVADKKAKKDPAQEREKITTTTVNDVKPEQNTMPAVRMHLLWQPEAEELASYLSAYEIDARFATHDVLPEFVDFWSNKDVKFRPVQWQAKFHAQVRKQWDFEIAHLRRNAKINAAADEKADAIAAAKRTQAQTILTKAASSAQRRQATTEELMDRGWIGQYDFGIQALMADDPSRFERRQPTTAELTDTSWADKYDIDFED